MGFTWLITMIVCSFPVWGEMFVENFPEFHSHVNKRFYSPDFEQNYKTAAILLQKIYDHSAFVDVFMKLSNETFQPLIDCIKNRSNCTIDDLIPKLELIQPALDEFFKLRFKIDAHCSVDLSYHWAAMIKLVFVGAVEISCAANETLSGCNQNATMAKIQSILNENLWALIRK